MTHQSLMNIPSSSSQGPSPLEVDNYVGPTPSSILTFPRKDASLALALMAFKRNPMLWQSTGLHLSLPLTECVLFNSYYTSQLPVKPPKVRGGECPVLLRAQHLLQPCVYCAVTGVQFSPSRLNRITFDSRSKAKSRNVRVEKP